MNSEWLTLSQIADDLKVHVETVREWVRTRQLIAYKFGRDYRVRRDDYDKFVNERRLAGEDGES